MKKKLTKTKKRLLISGSYLLIGLLLWEVFLGYRYFALPVWGAGALHGFHWLFLWLKPKKPGLTGFLKASLAAFLVLALIFFCVVEGMILTAAKGTPDPQADYLLVLGAMVRGTVPSRSLAERLRAAKDYLDAYPEAKCVVSGGKGDGEGISEALCMYNWLTEHGIAPERILMEDQATSTWENLRFTLALLEKETGMQPQRLAVVSSEYHLCRAQMMAEDLGIEAVGVPARTAPLFSRIHYYFREFFGVVHYWILGS